MIHLIKQSMANADWGFSKQDSEKRQDETPEASLVLQQLYKH
jgi:hypothetical protein